MNQNEINASLQWLDSQQQEMLELVRRLCDQNSGTFNVTGLRRMEQMLLDEFALLGADRKPVEIATFETINDFGQLEITPLGPAIHLVCRPEIRPQVVLCIHMDTVYASSDPFQMCTMLDANRMNGPGVIDAKGGLVVMLFALRAFEASPLAGRLGWQVFINPDEEIGSPGSNEAIRKIAQTVDLGLLFEPSLPTGELVSWRRGSGGFHFVVHGKAAHAGRDFLNGRNAVAAMSRLMVAIDELNGDPEITYNVGRVSGGGALNIVPDLAIGRVNCRVRTLPQQEHVEKTLTDLVSRFNLSLNGIRIETFGGFTSPPKEVSAGTEALMRRIELCGQELGQAISWSGSGGASDGNKFAAAGLPNIDSLGPAGGEIHSAREFLHVDSLVPKAKLTARLLMSLAAEPLALS